MEHGAEETGNSGTSFDGALKINFPLIDGRKKNDSQRSAWEAEVVGGKCFENQGEEGGRKYLESMQ